MERPRWRPLGRSLGAASITAEKVALGRQLFYEVKLSKDNSLSCAGCHQPSASFSDGGKATSTGVFGQTGKRNAPSLVKGPDRSSLMMNPQDASARGLKAGDPVRVESRAGAVDARVEVTPNVRPGVVSLPHGFGHAVARDTLRVAGAVAGPNMNAVTDDALVEPLTGTAVLSGVPVSVSPASAT